MIGHTSYKDPSGELHKVGLFKQRVSDYRQVQSHLSSIRASKTGVSPELQGPGKICTDYERKPNARI